MRMSRKPHSKKGEHPMSTEENKALARRLIEETWNQGNLATVDELLAPGHVGHHSLVPNQPPGREHYKQYIVRTRTAFPDFHASIEEQIAEGDLVVTRWSVQGTHQGMFRGHSPTGKQMRSEEHTSELQSHHDLVCRLLLEKKKKKREIRSET